MKFFFILTKFSSQRNYTFYRICAIFNGLSTKVFMWLLRNIHRAKCYISEIIYNLYFFLNGIYSQIRRSYTTFIHYRLENIDIIGQQWRLGGRAVAWLQNSLYLGGSFPAWGIHDYMVLMDPPCYVRPGGVLYVCVTNNM